VNTEPLSLLYRRYAMGLLVAVNLLNYIDRQVLFAVFPLIKIDLRLSDTALGFLGRAVILSYWSSPCHQPGCPRHGLCGQYSLKGDSAV
jgi:hypothetical protein